MKAKDPMINEILIPRMIEEGFTEADTKNKELVDGLLSTAYQFIEDHENVLLVVAIAHTVRGAHKMIQGAKNYRDQAVKDLKPFLHDKIKPS